MRFSVGRTAQLLHTHFGTHGRARTPPQYSPYSTSHFAPTCVCPGPTAAQRPHRRSWPRVRHQSACSRWAPRGPACAPSTGRCPRPTACRMQRMGQAGQHSSTSPQRPVRQQRRLQAASCLSDCAAVLQQAASLSPCRHTSCPPYSLTVCCSPCAGRSRCRRLALRPPAVRSGCSHGAPRAAASRSAPPSSWPQQLPAPGNPPATCRRWPWQQTCLPRRQASARGFNQ